MYFDGSAAANIAVKERNVSKLQPKPFIYGEKKTIFCEIWTLAPYITRQVIYHFAKYAE